MKLQNKKSIKQIESISKILMESNMILFGEKRKIEKDYDFLSKAKDDYDWVEVDEVQDFINKKILEIRDKFTLEVQQE